MTRSLLLSKRPAFFPLGTVLRTPAVPFVFSDQSLSRHLAVLGGSGTGKSKFLELLCRNLLQNYRGFCFIDPHGDTAEDILAYAAREVDRTDCEAICRRIHYLEPSFETVFGFDPFEFRSGNNIPSHLRGNAYHAWLHAKADKVAEIVQRKQGQVDFQGMARLQRILRDVLISVGTALDADGKHLPLSQVLVLLDTQHPRHGQVLDLIRPHLPPEVRADFSSLSAYRSEEQRKKETESTINRLRSLLSPIVKAIVSSSVNTIDFHQILANRGIVLVNLRKTEFFSADQRNAVGGLLIHEILASAETTARENRTPFYLIVDEARLFAGMDLQEALDQARKFKLSICLAGQYLSQFRSDAFDMVPSILNNCGTIVTFQQKDPDDLEIWKKYFGYPNVSFQKHFQVMDRQRGYDFLDVEDWSESSSAGWNVSEGVSNTTTDGTSLTETCGSAYQTGSTESQSRQTGRTDSTSVSNGTNSSRGTSGPLSGTGFSSSQHLGYNLGEGESRQVVQGGSNSYLQGESSAVTESIASNRSVAHGRSHSEADGVTRGRGLSGSIGVTKNHKTIPVPHLEEEQHESPHLINSVQDQLDRFAQLLRILPQRHATVSQVDQHASFVVRIADVDPPDSNAKDLAARLDAMKRKIFGLHPYYTTPQLSPDEQDRRLEEFLRQATQATNKPNSGGGTQAPPESSENCNFVL